MKRVWRGNTPHRAVFKHVVRFPYGTRLGEGPLNGNVIQAPSGYMLTIRSVNERTGSMKPFQIGQVYWSFYKSFAVVRR